MTILTPANQLARAAFSAMRSRIFDNINSEAKTGCFFTEQVLEAGVFSMPEKLKALIGELRDAGYKVRTREGFSGGSKCTILVIEWWSDV